MILEFSNLEEESIVIKGVTYTLCSEVIPLTPTVKVINLVYLSEHNTVASFARFVVGTISSFDSLMSDLDSVDEEIQQYVGENQILLEVLGFLDLVDTLNEGAEVALMTLIFTEVDLRGHGLAANIVNTGRRILEGDIFFNLVPVVKEDDLILPIDLDSDDYDSLVTKLVTYYTKLGASPYVVAPDLSSILAPEEILWYTFKKISLIQDLA
jgi:hypothetical protein